MSIIIKGMEMPLRCTNCPFMTHYHCENRCLANRGNPIEFVIGNDRGKNCPLIPLPEKHGRLIDGDAFVDYMQNRYDNNEITNGDWIDFRLSLKDQPTIVPAETDE